MCCELRSILSYPWIKKSHALDFWGGIHVFEKVQFDPLSSLYYS